MEDRDRFNNLTNLRADNEIIDAILSGLTLCTEKACQPFVLHRSSMELSTVSRIVSFMKIEGLVDFKIGDYDQDAFDYNLKLLDKGDFIANSGGWISYLKSKMTESDWIDKVLADAGNHSVVLPRSTPDEYRKAVHDAISKGFIDPHSYYLLPKGQEVVDAKGFDKWKELSEAKTESEWIDQILDEALKSIAGMSKDSHPGYISALKKCIGLDLLTNSLTNPKLKESGYKVIELHGIDNWREYVKRQQANQSGSINIHGPVTGSLVSQGSDFGDLSQTYNATRAIPAANDHKQKAKTSLIGTWVAPTITAIVAIIVGGVIMYYFPDIVKFLRSK